MPSVGAHGVRPRSTKAGARRAPLPGTYGFTFNCVPVTARPPVCVACCVSVVVGAWSPRVYVGGTGDSGFLLGFFPSAPLLGSGAGPGIPCAVGVSDDFVTGCVIAGGLFW